MAVPFNYVAVVIALVVRWVLWPWLLWCSNAESELDVAIVDGGSVIYGVVFLHENVAEVPVFI